MDDKPNQPEPDEPSTDLSVPPSPKPRVGRRYVVECGLCRGRGVRIKHYGDVADRSQCPACHGKRAVTLYVTDQEMLRRCPYCRGKGLSIEIAGAPGHACRGVGAMALRLDHGEGGSGAAGPVDSLEPEQK